MEDTKPRREAFLARLVEYPFSRLSMIESGPKSVRILLYNELSSRVESMRSAIDLLVTIPIIFILIIRVFEILFPLL